MPSYEYECSSCEVIFECFESMTEHAEFPTPHCPKCDPLRQEDTTMLRYMGRCKPAFKLGGGGVADSGWH